MCDVATLTRGRLLHRSVDRTTVGCSARRSTPPYRRNRHRRDTAGPRTRRPDARPAVPSCFDYSSCSVAYHSIYRGGGGEAGVVSRRRGGGWGKLSLVLDLINAVGGGCAFKAMR